MKAARQLAIQALGPQDATAIQRLAFVYETVTSQLPDTGEQEVLASLIENLQEKYIANPALADEICSGMSLPDAGKKAQLAAWTVLVNTLYNLDVTKARE